MKKYTLFILLGALIGLSSCASLRIEKRHYSNGWYVDFGNEKKSSDTPVTTKEETAVLTTESVDTETLGTAAEVARQQVAVVPNGVPAVDEIGISSVPTEEVVVIPESAEEQNPQQVGSDNEEHGAAESPADTELIILVILAILLPPIAVYLKQKLSTWFWVTLICWLLGGTFLFGPFGYGYLGALGLLAIVIALLVVFDQL